MKIWYSIENNEKIKLIVGGTTNIKSEYLPDFILTIFTAHKKFVIPILTSEIDNKLYSDNCEQCKFQP